MCFLFIIGIMPRETPRGQVVRYCPVDGRETMHTLIDRRMWFTLFFIPLFPVSRKQTIARCGECGYGRRAEADREEEVPTRVGAPGERAAGVCPSCGGRVAPDAIYCQQCGLRLPDRESWDR